MKWTTELDDQLRQNYHTMTYKEMGDKMGIKPKAILARAGILKLGKKSTAKELVVGEIVNGWKILEILGKNVLVIAEDGSQTRKFRVTAVRKGEMASPDTINDHKRYDNSITLHKLYTIWRAIKTKCKKYNIELEDSWLDYNAFYQDNISTYQENLCFSRIDCMRGFVKGNCNYSSRSEISAKNGKVGGKKRKGIKQSKETRAKIQETCIARYGTTSPLLNSQIKDKIKQTLLDKYGVDHSSKMVKTQETKRKKSLEKHGVDHYTKTPEYKQAAKQRAIDSGLTYIYDGKTAEVIAKELGVSLSGFHQRVRNYGYESAIKMEKTKTDIEHRMEQLLYKLQIKYLTGQTVDKYKPDFILPDHNIIIECDGLYWHSDAIQKDKYYHRDKKQLYKDKGYNALFFREDEIIAKIDIVESMVAHRCKMSKSIFARKCTIEELPFKEIEPFLQSYHLMSVGSGKGVCLKYNGEIVAVSQIVQRDYIDISRFCTKPMINIVGGFSKVMSYLKKYNKPIQTFIDGRYGTGDYLLELGFELKNKDISFKWVKNDKTFHRMKYKGNTGYQEKCYKIWDCGQYKYVKKA